MHALCKAGLCSRARNFVVLIPVFNNCSSPYDSDIFILRHPGVNEGRRGEGLDLPQGEEAHQKAADDRHAQGLHLHGGAPPPAGAKCRVQ